MTLSRIRMTNSLHVQASKKIGHVRSGDPARMSCAAVTSSIVPIVSGTAVAAKITVGATGAYLLCLYAPYQGIRGTEAFPMYLNRV